VESVGSSSEVELLGHGDEVARLAISHPHDDPDTFLADFAERAWNSGDYASTLYAVSLPHKVRADAVKPIFESMVELSDHGNLLTRFLALPLPRMVMYGEQNRSLSATGRGRRRARRDLR
jgi:hypothetical protein